MKIIYDITLKNWEKYNKQSKPGLPYIMISKRFFDDEHIQTLPASGRLLYLFLLLRCGDVGQTSFGCSHDDCKTSAGGRGVVVTTLLDQLQSFQLLEWSIRPSNRIEVKGIEVKSSKSVRVKREPPIGLALGKADSEQIPISVLPPEKAIVNKPQPSRTHEVVAAYCDAWKVRYPPGSPKILPQHAKQIKTLVESFGFEEAKKIVEAYLKIPDKWFLEKRHDIPTLMSNLNKVTHFMQTNRVVTDKDIKQVMDRVNSDNLRRGIDEGQI